MINFQSREISRLTQMHSDGKWITDSTSAWNLQRTIKAIRKDEEDPFAHILLLLHANKTCKSVHLAASCLFFLSRLFTLEIKIVGKGGLSSHMLFHFFFPRGKMASCHLCFWLVKWFMPRSLRNSACKWENALWLNQMCTIKRHSHCNLGYLVYMKPI